MSWNKNRTVGLVHHDPRAAYPGYTLYSCVRGDHATLIDMEGSIVQRWHFDDGIQHSVLLPSGNLLLHTSPPKDAGGAEKIGGSAAGLIELDWDGNVVWEYRHDMMHHDFVRLPNGNHLIPFTQALPEGLTEKVKGGRLHEEDPERMWSDIIREVTSGGEVVYEWRSWEHLSFDEDVVCPLETRREWTHLNSISLTPQGDMLVSFRSIDTIGVIDRETGDFEWKWGKDRLSHPHQPTWLDSGKILLFDNGAHRFKDPSYSEVIEVDPTTEEVTWNYKADPLVAFFSFAISGVERLSNGNTLICEGVHGRFFEITKEGETIWEYNSPFFYASKYGTTSSAFRAYRYGVDYPGLQGRELDPDRYAELNRQIANENQPIVIERPSQDESDDGTKDDKR